MTDTIHCPNCGQPLPPDAPQGECPRCLLQAGLESQPAVAGMAPSGVGPIAVTRTSSAHSHFVPPTVAELQLRIPQYEILELIGQGGMGAVYKARQRGLERLVAIKILPFEVSQSTAFAERFAREARALAMLSHPHIVAVHDFGQAEGMCYFVMEYVAGVNLRQAIQAGKMNPAEALAIVPQICEALQFAHDEGVVHRDIKPENILIDTRGRVKIADFGLAKLLGTQTPEHSLTGTQQVMGTLRYMAPEQMFGSKEVDHRADIFSLGVVFYELLTGELPIGRFAPPSKKAAVDARLDDVVLRALESEPAERYQHVSEMKTGVEAVAKAPPMQRAPTPPPMQPTPGPTAPQSFLGTPYHLLLCCALSLATLWFVLYFGPPVLTMIDGPDLELLKVGRDWDLGTTVNSIMSTLVVAFIVLAGGTAFAWWKYREAGLQQQHESGAIALRDARATTASDEPRLSRTALWGAILAPLFLLTLLIISGSTIVVHRVDGVSSGPPLAMRIVAMVLLVPGVVGLVSPFATTLLGILAISQIRNAKGKLYGLPLAVFDALVYPLLLLDVLLVWLGFLLFVMVLSLVLQLGPNQSMTVMGPLLLTVLLIVPMVLVLDAWLVRLAWQAANKGLEGKEEKKPLPYKEPPPFQPSETGNTSLAVVIVFVVLAIFAIPVVLAGGVLAAYFFSHGSSPAPARVVIERGNDQGELRAVTPPRPAELNQPAKEN